MNLISRQFLLLGWLSIELKGTSHIQADLNEHQNFTDPHVHSFTLVLHLETGGTYSL